MNGTIKKLSDRGFGFIGRDGEEKDVFFHATELTEVKFDELHEGDAVTFDLVETDKGLSATNIAKA